MLLLSIATLFSSALAMNQATAGGASGLGHSTPAFRAGDTFVATTSYGPPPGGAGILRIDGETGGCSELVPMSGVLGFAANFDFSSYDDRLVVWGQVAGVTTNNFDRGLFFIDAAGSYTLIDLPQGQIPTAIACDRRGRTFLNPFGSIYYVDGVGPSFVLSPLLNDAGTAPQQLSGGVQDWRYIPSINALVAQYTRTEFLPSGTLVSAVLEVLPLTPQRDQVARPSEVLLFPHTDPIGGIGFIPPETGNPDPRLLVGVINTLGICELHAVSIDSSTFVPSSLYCAARGAPGYVSNAVTYSWKHDAGLVLDTGSNAIYLLPCGTSGIGTAFTPLDCVSGPGGSGELVSMETIPPALGKVRRQ